MTFKVAVAALLDAKEPRKRHFLHHRSSLPCCSYHSYGSPNGWLAVSSKCSNRVGAVQTRDWETDWERRCRANQRLISYPLCLKRWPRTALAPDGPSDLISLFCGLSNIDTGELHVRHTHSVRQHSQAQKSYAPGMLSDRVHLCFAFRSRRNMAKF